MHVPLSKPTTRSRSQRLARLALPCSLLFCHRALAGYTYTDLNSIANSFSGNTTQSSRGISINSSGTLVGSYTVSSVTTFFTLAPGSTAPVQYPVVNGTQLDYASSVPGGGRLINDSGNFLADKGTLAIDGTPVGGFYKPTTSTFTQFPSSLTYQTTNQVVTGIQPYAINAGNYSVGVQYFETDPTSQYPSSNYHGVVYNPVTNTTLDIGGAAPGSGASATDGGSTLEGISDNNHIVGSASGPTTGHSSPRVAILGVPNGSGGYNFTDLSSLIAASMPSGYSYMSSFATNISPSGRYIVGTYTASSGTRTYTRSFEIIDNTTAVDLGTLGSLLTNQADAVAVNDSGVVVGYAPVFNGSAYANHAFVYSSGTMSDLNSLAPVSNTVFSEISGINSNGQLVGYADGRNAVEPQFSGFLLTPTVAATSDLTFLPGGGSHIWDTSTPNFNNGTSQVAFAPNDNVTFNDSNNGVYQVTLNSIVSPGSTLISSAGNYNFNGPGGIGGTGALTKTLSGSLTLGVTDTYSGATNISGGSVILAVAGALPSGTNLHIGDGASLIANVLSTKTTLQVGTLDINSGTLDLNNNGLIVHNSTIWAVNTLVQSGYNSGNWNGSTGIISGNAAKDIMHLTALGVILNTVDGTSTGAALYGSGTTKGSFQGTNPTSTDVLVKFTYYGDANLDGLVDGSDYSRIDNAFLYNQSHLSSPLSGWFNGDFNYDGSVDGSDYTLIDNAFNTQGANLATSIANPTALATALFDSPVSAVPEPTAFALLTIALGGLLHRRCRRCD